MLQIQPGNKFLVEKCGVLQRFEPPVGARGTACGLPDPVRR